jgi:hypothetical protein
LDVGLDEGYGEGLVAGVVVVGVDFRRALGLVRGGCTEMETGFRIEVSGRVFW